MCVCDGGGEGEGTRRETFTRSSIPEVAVAMET